MCCTLHASHLTGTKLYAGEARYQGKYVHVLGYQNDAENAAPGPNAMLLPIPAASHLGPENVIDTREFKGFLGDIAESTKKPSFSRSRSLSKGMADAAFDHDSLEIFDVGSYTVVVGTKMGEAAKAVGSLPLDRRPKLNLPVLNSMAALYPGWSFAFCCWNGTIKAEPLLWWYEPKAPEFLFAPALDAHDGTPPKEEMVPVDHIVMFGSAIKPTGYMDVRYNDKIPDASRSLMPNRAVGESLRQMMPNGDFWYPTRNFDGEPIKDHPQPALRFFPGAETQKTTVPLGTWR